MMPATNKTAGGRTTGLSARLNRRILLQHVVRTPNGSGGHSKGWTAGVPLFAELTPLRGGEALDQALQRSTQLWRVTIRYRDDVTPESRFIYRDQVLNIRSVADPDHRRDKLVLTAESGVNT